MSIYVFFPSRWIWGAERSTTERFLCIMLYCIFVESVHVIVKTSACPMMQVLKIIFFVWYLFSFHNTKSPSSVNFVHRNYAHIHDWIFAVWLYNSHLNFERVCFYLLHTSTGLVNFFKYKYDALHNLFFLRTDKRGKNILNKKSITQKQKCFFGVNSWILHTIF